MGEEKKIEIKKEKKEQKSRELAIKHESPFSLFQKMDRYFDDLRRGFFNDWYWPFKFMRTRPLSLTAMEAEPFFRTPLANITEDENNFNILTEIPGLEKKDIEILIHDGNLEIKGEIREEKKEEKKGELIRREFRSSSYYRCFSLPENIDEDAIDANLDNGVLRITIPKTKIEKKEKKKIEIQ
jgi:HSP20 family protein